MLERNYQAGLIRQLKWMFPGAIVLKNDTAYMQGIPDLTVLHEDRWAALECKASEKAPIQANQDYYIDRMNAMSFGAFIYPENEEEVLRELQRAFQPRR